ncbi:MULTISPECIES: class I SAM-dependent methyltransferase [Amycolatopsis]|nr:MULTISPECIES: class I SAM-dependent methyltransferase [Amycolatopsis]OAP25742.1 Leucine carboxyl methyltransferase [Amycolatopsis sp. M39]
MGVEQYVILGAELDFYAYRGASHARVFEVDKPATRRCKQRLLADFEQEQSLTGHLGQGGFDPDRPALVSWLGVTMDRTEETISQTRHAISG